MAGLLDQYPWFDVAGDRPGLLGYPIRDPYDSERKFFMSNPRVAGMATEDSAVTLNPSMINPRAREAVALNEALRLYMRQFGLNAPAPTENQLRAFQGTAYEKDPGALGQSVIARMLSGDPSAGVPSEEQLRYAEWLRSILTPRGW